MAEVVFDHVDKIYENGFHAVQDFSLDIADGEFLVLVGPSGCGKTTALRMAAGLEDITRGELRIGGRGSTTCRAATATSPWCSRATPYPHMSVRDNIGFGLSFVTWENVRSPPRRSVSRRPSVWTSYSTASRGCCPVASVSGSPWVERSSATRRCS